MTDLSPNAELPTEQPSYSNTLDTLLSRMNEKSDFPALSTTINEINKVVDSDTASHNHLAQSILHDFALTNKLLKLVNTVTYGQFGGQINTISKAVVILGFESVRNVAMTLILMDFLQNKAQASQLKDDVLASFFTGIMAAQLSANHQVKNAEEAMICSMFRNLGKLLASFYLFDESQQVTQLVEQGLSEDDASTQILGMSYNELGIGVAKSWNFPTRLIMGMRKLSGNVIAKPNNELETLSVTVNLAHELCEIASKGDVAEKPAALKHLAKRYENAVTISDHQLRTAMDSGLGELSTRSKIVGINIAQSPMMKRINTWAGTKTESASPKKSDETDDLSGVTQLNSTTENDSDTNTKVDPETMLTQGIQDVTNTLVEEHQVNDIMQMVLETMHRSMGFGRTLLLVRDVKTQEMSARFGFGADIDKVLRKFHFPVHFSPDVFHLAMEKGLDLMIEDISAENIANKIPAWYKQTVSSQSFILLPINVNNKPVGIFYADMEQAHSMQITPKQLSLLRTLRNQSVLAIKQKS
jgi:HD-like signal output (HDOD) protein